MSSISLNDRRFSSCSSIFWNFHRFSPFCRPISLNVKEWSHFLVFSLMFHTGAKLHAKNQKVTCLGFEPRTSRLQSERSTTEPLAHECEWSISRVLPQNHAFPIFHLFLRIFPTQIPIRAFRLGVICMLRPSAPQRQVMAARACLSGIGALFARASARAIICEGRLKLQLQAAE